VININPPIRSIWRRPECVKGWSHSRGSLPGNTQGRDQDSPAGRDCAGRQDGALETGLALTFYVAKESFPTQQKYELACESVRSAAEVRSVGGQITVYLALSHSAL
jgi:hypothetical protein